MAQAKSPINVTKDDFYRERSRFLDGFADVEQAIAKLAERMVIDPKAASLGKRLEALRKLQPSPTLSKASAKTIVTLSTRLKELNALRVDIVHAHMAFAEIEGKATACFRNSQSGDCDFPPTRLLAYDQLIAINEETETSAREAARLGPNPPASPPPPSLGGATDP